MTNNNTAIKTYKLDSPSGVRALLRDRAHIGALREKGDMDAADMLIDLDRAIAAADITDRQAMAIALVYGLDLTRGAAAAELGVSRDAINNEIWTACKRIASVFRAQGETEVEVVFQTNSIAYY